MGQYHAALKQEIVRFGQALASLDTSSLKTVFFGGGTPSTYPPELLLDISAILRSTFNFDPSYEMTIEVNPGTVTDEKLQIWKQIGINRLSIGVQSLDDTVLHSLGRKQSARDVFELLEKAQYLFNNISVDLIMGLPGVSFDAWKQFIKTLVQLPITHISSYFLTVHEDTPLYFGVKTNRVILPADDAVVDVYEWTVEELAKQGFLQYEVSSFARPGFECRHNSAYWQRKSYKGFGMGACSFDGASRFQNTKNLGQYLALNERDESLTIFNETLTPEQIYLEKLLLGLRQTKGIAHEELYTGLLVSQQQKLQSVIADLCAEGYLEDNNNHIRLTGKGLAVEHELIIKLSIH